jgi:hypothetical protein
MRPIHCLTLAVGLVLPVQGAARADIVYNSQVIARAGDKAGDITLGPSPEFQLAGLNDKGQLLFVATDAVAAGVILQYADARLAPVVKKGDQAGDVRISTIGDAIVGPNENGQFTFLALDANDRDLLIQSSGGQLLPIVAPDKDAPGGKWDKGGRLLLPVSMNQRGNVAFVASVTAGGQSAAGTFRWDAQARQVTAVAAKGLPATGGRSLEDGRGRGVPIINERDEIAFEARVKDAAGKLQEAIFLSSPAQPLQAVALPDQPLPDGSKLQSASFPALNDAGLVAFVALRQGLILPGFYLWEAGMLTTLPVGAGAPGGGKIVDVTAVRVNKRRPRALVAAQLDRTDGPLGLYLFAGGQLTPVAIPGAPMPGGGNLSKLEDNLFDISAANDQGQYAFVAVLEDGSTGAYLVQPEGTLALIRKSGDSTDQGKIVLIDEIAGPNNKGEVALSVILNTTQGERDALLLETPAGA